MSAVRLFAAGLRVAPKREIHTTLNLGGAAYHAYERIGKREIVGYGLNGEPGYVDRYDFPYPAIRFREDDAALAKLREKEKGDWKNLSLAEKKQLYRSSFCQTFVEVGAPTGEWKLILAGTLGCLSVALWMFILIHKYIYKPLPMTFSEEWKEAMLERMIDLRAEPITGIASKWDYEKNRWKE